MVVRLSRKNTIIFFLCIYIFVCVFFPMDKYYVKIISFIIICILSIPDFIYAFKNKQMSNIFIMGMIYPLVLIFMSFVNNQNMYNAISGAYSASLILLVIPIIRLEISDEYKKIFEYVLFGGVVFTDVLALLDILRIYDLNQASAFRTFYYDMGIGYMGKSVAYSSYYRIFLKTSPLFIFLLDVFWNDRKWIKLYITFIAIYFSGTRANIIVAVIYIIWRLLFKVFKNKRNQLFVAIFVICVIIGISGNIFDVLEQMMTTSGSVASDAIRSGQFKGLMEEIKKPTTFLFGTGFGTKFFDYGRAREISGVELSYFDLLRQIGIIMFIPLMNFIFKPLWNKKIDMSFKISYLGYLAIAFTNPLLFTSTAYLAYTLIQIKSINN